MLLIHITFVPYFKTTLIPMLKYVIINVDKYNKEVYFYEFKSNI